MSLEDFLGNEDAIEAENAPAEPGQTDIAVNDSADPDSGTGEQSAENAESTGVKQEDESQSPGDQEQVGGKEVAGLKAELARIREQNRALKEQSTPVEKPDFWEEPEKVMSELEERIERRSQERYLNMLESTFREKHEDYDKIMDVYEQMVQSNPALVNDIMSKANPVEAAYKAATQHSKMQEFGDISTFEAKIRAEERAKVEAEFSGKFESEVSKRAKIPPSLADARAVGGGKVPEWSGPPSMNDILGKKEG